MAARSVASHRARRHSLAAQHSFTKAADERHREDRDGNDGASLIDETALIDVGEVTSTLRHIHAQLSAPTATHARSTGGDEATRRLHDGEEDAPPRDEAGADRGADELLGTIPIVRGGTALDAL